MVRGQKRSAPLAHEKEELTAYELQRQENIRLNNEHLRSLNLEADIVALREKPKKPTAKRPKSAAPAEPSRGSRRLQGLPEEHSLPDVPRDLADGGSNDEAHASQLKTAPTSKRLTVEQAALLNSLEEVSAEPLTSEELDVLKNDLPEFLKSQSTGNWRTHQKKGTSLYGEKRAVLRDAADALGLRWPTWLDKIEAALPPMGNTQSARDQTMWAIERAACGVGLFYKHWPEGIGVLLANDEEEVETTTPRLLTLGSDTEALKREGHRLELRFGRDVSNGWAYNHALGKVRLYQELLLRTEYAQVPSAPSVAEEESAAA